MKLAHSFIQLPLRFDSERLREEVLAIPESAWNPHPQGFPGNSALLLIARDGDPRNDTLTGPMLPTANLHALPYLQQVLAAFNTVWGRSRLMRIDGNAEANWHMDANYYWHQRMRLHVPIQTNEAVRFHCGDDNVHMTAGESWIFNTWQMHNVFNPHPDRRIHLVADTLGSAHFWSLIRRGRAVPGIADDGWQPDAPIAFQPDQPTTLLTEQHNAPAIMSPWEMEKLIDLIFADLQDAADPVARQAQAWVRDFIQDWHMLWARFADHRQGLPHYQRLREQMQQQLQRLPELKLANGMPLASMLRQVLIAASINEISDSSHQGIAHSQLPDPGRSPAATTTADPSATPVACPAVSQRPVATVGSALNSSPFDRPVFIVAAPRSGSSWLFETLARSPELLTLGGEGHAEIESIPGLRPDAQADYSNRLDSTAANADTVMALRNNYLAGLKTADGVAAKPAQPFRFLEKTPKNALRITFLKAAFPDARFIYLHRRAEENIASIIEAWQSGRFVTYPKLSAWQGPAWSLLLPPGWQALNGKALAEIAAWQWSTSNNQMLEALSNLPTTDWMQISYQALCDDPAKVLAQVCAFIDISALPSVDSGKLSRHTLTPPDPDKWRKHEAAIMAQQGIWQPISERIAQLARESADHPCANPPTLASGAPTMSEPSDSSAGNTLAPGQASKHDTHQNDADSGNALDARMTPGDSPADQSAADNTSQHAEADTDNTAPAAAAPIDFSSVFTSNFPTALKQLGVTLLVTTYQAGKLIVVREQQGKLNTHFKLFSKPMGLAGDINKFAIGTFNRVEEFRNMPAAARNLPGDLAHDGVYVPRQQHITGDIDIHEMAFDSKDQLWFINTRFSCLCVRDFDHSFVPKWRPPHITGYAPEDRCHLNGLAMRNGKPRYVTMLGKTNERGGWRENKRNGGLLMDIADNRIICEGLSMPHSPRWYRDTLWVLESGEGSLVKVDLKSGKLTTVCTLPGFTRGLDFYGDYAFIGLSQVRESAIFSGLPLTERDEPRYCGVWVVNISNGETVAFLRFEGSVQEIFAVQALPGLRHPEVLDADDPLVNSCYALPDDALKLVDHEAIERSRAQAREQAREQTDKSTPPLS